MSLIAALIPARQGSKRIPGKNIRPLGGHPLIAYAIQGAMDSGLFDKHIYVSTDSEEIGRIAQHYGATFIRRLPEYALDSSPDAEWIAHTLSVVCDHRGVSLTGYAILRPTNPFRTGETIKRAYGEWDQWSHMKAIERVHQHPAKMWILDNLYMHSLWGGDSHLCQTNTLAPVYVQNASLEFRILGKMNAYQPFHTQGWEGMDLNEERDWMLVESLIEKGMATLPKIERSPYATAL